jgi:hypothetical protein
VDGSNMQVPKCVRSCIEGRELVEGEDDSMPIRFDRSTVGMGQLRGYRV